MLHKHSLLGCIAIAFLAVAAWAGVIQDPAAGVEADNFSSPISTLSGTFDPTANGGVLGLYNHPGSIITALSLHTTIAEGLTSSDIGRSQTFGDGGVQRERGDDGAGVVIQAENAAVGRWVKCTAKCANGGAEVIGFHTGSRILDDAGPCRNRQKRYRDAT